VIAADAPSLEDGQVTNRFRIPRSAWPIVATVGNFGGGELLVVMVLALMGIAAFIVGIFVLLARRKPAQIVVVPERDGEGA